MPLPFILILVVIAGVIGISAAVNLNKKTNAAWKSAAGKLNLTFIPSEIFTHPTISGTINGFKVYVSTFSKQHGKSRTTYTKFRLSYPKSLGLGLKLTRESFFSGIGKFFGAQDIKIGDEGFDNAFTIQGSDPSRIQEYLTRSRRMRITRFLGAYDGSFIDDHKIEWNRRSVMRESDRIVRTVQRMATLAGHLTETPVEDEAVDKALEARQQGRLDEALDIVRETTARDKSDEEDLHVMEGEILLAGGQLREAVAVFKEISKAAPEDEESQALAGLVSVKPEPAVDESAPGTDLDVAEVCELLFNSSRMSSETTKLFEESFHGKPVRWTGTLTNIRSYSFDLVFGREPGIRAEVEVYEVVNSYSKRAVQAIIQFPADAEENLRSKIDGRISFEGTLVSCDAFMRNLFVADGRIL